MANPEIDQVSQPEQGDQQQVESRPEELSLPEHIEEGTGIQATPTQLQSLTDDSGQVVAQSHPGEPELEVISIETDPETAHTWSGGKFEDSKTWLGVRVIRRVKQAILSGRKIIIGGN
jgi:hypothetical protein